MRRSYNKNSLPLLFSHGAHDPRYNNENFSNYNRQGDIPYTKYNKIDGYLATPVGKIKYYNYTNNAIIRLKQ
ncbi:hypothetical protein [uncultured Gammaproteobacteria bacterium]|nr:hypothetical protein [uncultured Gammaproteobacteria bacterium]CAC9610799.1 hypothetical protein [uncultured Gammaproteobacteria bacterium]CAC9959759.1 hypothetical protein [uncultured Gammaproteobacteria bacterium]